MTDERRLLLLNPPPHRLAWTLLLLTSVSGCGSQSEFKMVPVTGTVSLDGQPLAGAMTKFFPAGKVNEESQGRTDASGKFQLDGVHGKTGAMPGEHKVVITRLVMKDGTPVDPKIDFALVVHEARESLPATYSNIDETTLTATVPAAGGNIDFQLKSKP